MDDELTRKLELTIGEMDFSVRASNCLESGGVKTARDLVSLTEEELLGFCILFVIAGHETTTKMIATSDNTRNGGGPFVPAFKTCLLVYRSEERKITIGCSIEILIFY